ncbi:MAG TPA: VWA domain-containing protein [Polyangia bacterium]|jgi:Ca-activated chloride channel family protein
MSQDPALTPAAPAPAAPAAPAVPPAVPVRPRRRAAAPAPAARTDLLEHLIPYLLLAALGLPTIGVSAYLLVDQPGLGVATPAAAVLLLLVPFAAVMLFHERTKRASAMLFSRVGDVARCGRSAGARLAPLPAVLRLLALTLIVVAAVGPQSTAADKVDVEGIDMILALDMSNSMEEADLVPDRLSAAKRVIDDFIVRRRQNQLNRGDRIGMVVFGREAYTYCPLTFDHDVLRSLLRDLRIGFVDGRGTAIGNALGVALNRLRHSDAKSKVVILLTDGDNNAGNISPQQAARFARTLGVRIYTILMGQNEEADPFGPRVPLARRYPVNPKLLEEIATTTGGNPYLATDTQALESRFHHILSELERSKLKDASLAHTPLFPPFLFAALGLLGLEVVLSLTRFRKLP